MIRLSKKEKLIGIERVDALDDEVADDTDDAEGDIVD
jgi:hypothetical protein